jgi:mannose-1-phosphate guanylyltransferase
MVGPAMNAPRATILAAGLGTRLGGLSAVRPKPMLPVCGAPLVRWVALWLRSQGVREVVVNLHHLGDQIEAELGDGSKLGMAIAYSREDGEILGTGGALRHARRLLDDGSGAPIVVVNGKILLELELARVLAVHRAAQAEATMVLRPDPEAERWGSLRVDAEGRVVGLLGALRPGAEAAEPLMFTGVHVLEPRFLDRIPAEGPQCVIRTAYTELFHTGRGLAGVVTRDYWWEHSTVQRYLQGVANVLEGRVRLPYAERPLRGAATSASIGAGAHVDPAAWIGERAVIGAGAHVGPRVQIGDGAVIAPGVRLRDAIVWDGVEVTSDVECAVLSEGTA